MFNCQKDYVTFAPELQTEEQRSKSIAKLLEMWRNEKRFECLSGWRNELYWVSETFNSPAILKIERAGVGVFGFRSFGCHLNGYTLDPTTGELKFWISRRSADRPTWPNLLDNFVSFTFSIFIFSILPFFFFQKRKIIKKYVRLQVDFHMDIHQGKIL